MRKRTPAPSQRRSKKGQQLKGLTAHEAHQRVLNAWITRRRKYGRTGFGGRRHFAADHDDIEDIKGALGHHTPGHLAKPLDSGEDEVGEIEARGLDPTSTSIRSHEETQAQAKRSRNMMRRYGLMHEPAAGDEFMSEMDIAQMRKMEDEVSKLPPNERAAVLAVLRGVDERTLKQRREQGDESADPYIHGPDAYRQIMHDHGSVFSTFGQAAPISHERATYELRRSFTKRDPVARVVGEDREISYADKGELQKLASYMVTATRPSASTAERRSAQISGNRLLNRLAKKASDAKDRRDQEAQAMKLEQGTMRTAEENQRAFNQVYHKGREGDPQLIEAVGKLHAWRVDPIDNQLAAINKRHQAITDVAVERARALTPKHTGETGASYDAVIRSQIARERTAKRLGIKPEQVSYMRPQEISSVMPSEVTARRKELYKQRVTDELKKSQHEFDALEDDRKRLLKEKAEALRGVRRSAPILAKTGGMGPPHIPGGKRPTEEEGPEPEWMKQSPRTYRNKENEIVPSLAEVPESHDYMEARFRRGQGYERTLPTVKESYDISGHDEKKGIKGVRAQAKFIRQQQKNRANALRSGNLYVAKGGPPHKASFGLSPDKQWMYVKATDRDKYGRLLDVEHQYVDWADQKTQLPIPKTAYDARTGQRRLVENNPVLQEMIVPRMPAHKAVNVELGRTKGSRSLERQVKDVARQQHGIPPDMVDEVRFIPTPGMKGFQVRPSIGEKETRREIEEQSYKRFARSSDEDKGRIDIPVEYAARKKTLVAHIDPNLLDLDTDQAHRINVKLPIKGKDAKGSFARTAFLRSGINYIPGPGEELTASSGELAMKYITGPGRVRQYEGVQKESMRRAAQGAKDENQLPGQRKYYGRDKRLVDPEMRRRFITEKRKAGEDITKFKSSRELDIHMAREQRDKDESHMKEILTAGGAAAFYGTGTRLRRQYYPKAGNKIFRNTLAGTDKLRRKFNPRAPSLLEAAEHYRAGKPFKEGVVAPLEESIVNLKYMVEHPLSSPVGDAVGLDVSRLKYRKWLIPEDVMHARELERARLELQRIGGTQQFFHETSGRTDRWGKFLRSRREPLMRDKRYGNFGEQFLGVHTPQKVDKVTGLVTKDTISTPLSERFFNTPLIQRAQDIKAGRKVSYIDELTGKDIFKAASVAEKEEARVFLGALETERTKFLTREGFFDKNLGKAGTAIELHGLHPEFPKRVPKGQRWMHGSFTPHERTFLIGAGVLGAAAAGSYGYHRYKRSKEPEGEKRSYWNRMLPPPIKTPPLPSAGLLWTKPIPRNHVTNELLLGGKKLPKGVGVNIKKRHIRLRPMDRPDVVGETLPKDIGLGLTGIRVGTPKTGRGGKLSFAIPEQGPGARRRYGRVGTHEVRVKGKKVPLIMDIGRREKIKTRSRNPQRLTQTDVDRLVYHTKGTPHEAGIVDFYSRGIPNTRVIEGFENPEVYARASRKYGTRQEKAFQASLETLGGPKMKHGILSDDDDDEE